MGIVFAFIVSLVVLLACGFGLRAYLSQPWVSRRLQSHVVGFFVGLVGLGLLGITLIFAMFPYASQGFERSLCAVPFIVLFIAGVLKMVRRLEAIERHDKVLNVSTGRDGVRSVPTQAVTQLLEPARSDEAFAAQPKADSGARVKRYDQSADEAAALKIGDGSENVSERARMERTVESKMQKPWPPRIVMVIALLFGLLAGGIVAGINFQRLGRQEKKWRMILIGALAVGALILVPQPMALLVNVVGALILARAQQVAFDAWRREHPDAKPANAWQAVAWSMPGLAITLSIAGTVAIVNRSGVPVASPTDSRQAPVSTGPAISTGRIAFDSWRDGNGEIYVMNADGSGQTNLTNNPEGDYNLAWSPDGMRIAFVSDRDGNEEIYVMEADGSGPTRLTSNLAYDGGPAWSPDGMQIAFMSKRDGNTEIYVMKADGSGQTRLTNRPPADIEPAWSPDGTQIAFYDSEIGGGIYAINADGSGQITLTTNPEGDWGPVWSPDGKQIAFISKRDGDDQIYVMNADGSGQIRLTNSLGGNTAPAWSPDGRRIAFTSYGDGNPESFVMNADGSGQTRLTNSPASDNEPAWSPDGGWIAFKSKRDGNWEIYAMNANGSGAIRLTHDPADDFGPAWRT